MKARQIKALRTRLGLTQTEFFDHLGMKAKSGHVKRQTIHRWETGERNAETAARALLAVLANKVKRRQKEGTCA